MSFGEVAEPLTLTFYTAIRHHVNTGAIPLGSDTQHATGQWFIKFTSPPRRSPATLGDFHSLA